MSRVLLRQGSSTASLRRQASSEAINAAGEERANGASTAASLMDEMETVWLCDTQVLQEQRTGGLGFYMRPTVSTGARFVPIQRLRHDPFRCAAETLEASFLLVDAQSNNNRRTTIYRRGAVRTEEVLAADALDADMVRALSWLGDQDELKAPVVPLSSAATVSPSGGGKKVARTKPFWETNELRKQSKAARSASAETKESGGEGAETKATEANGVEGEGTEANETEVFGAETNGAEADGETANGMEAKTR